MKAVAVALLTTLVSLPAEAAWNGRDSPGGDGGYSGGGNDRYGIFGGGNPTGLRMGGQGAPRSGGSTTAPRDVGGRSVGPGGTIGAI